MKYNQLVLVCWKQSLYNINRWDSNRIEFYSSNISSIAHTIFFLDSLCLKYDGSTHKMYNTISIRLSIDPMSPFFDWIMNVIPSDSVLSHIHIDSNKSRNNSCSTIPIQESQQSQCTYIYKTESTFLIGILNGSS